MKILTKSLTPYFICSLSVLVVLLSNSTSVEAKDAKPKIKILDKKFDEFIQNGDISCAITVVANKSEILHYSKQGLSNLSTKAPLTDDSMFWIASMTKPITGFCMMQLVEQGKVSLEDPVEKYIPEFKNLKFKDGTKATPKIVHLLTHTSGMGEITLKEGQTCLKLVDAVELYVTKPVGFEPGSRWKYCQSGINTAGRIIEIVSGMELPEYFEKNVFKPLGMKNTTFYLTEEQNKKLVMPYRMAVSPPAQSPVSKKFGIVPTSKARFPWANGGLFSTAEDYLKFAMMLLNEGELNGVKLAKPETVKIFRTIHSGDVETGFTPGNGWGVGCCIIKKPQGITASVSKGTFGHGGAFGTQIWIDPVKERIFLLMVQRSDFYNADGSNVRKVFHDVVNKALDK